MGISFLSCPISDALPHSCSISSGFIMLPANCYRPSSAFFFSSFLYILYYNFFKKSKNNTYFRKEVATGEGLEPPTVLPATVFKTAPSSSRIPAKCVSTKNNETFLWWGTWDLNPHVLRRQSLNLVRLPFRQSPMVNELRYYPSIFILPTKKTLGAYSPFRKN